MTHNSGERRSADTPKLRWDQLTIDEWQLVVLAAAGWNDREIAEAAGETSGRVSSRFRQLLAKLEVSDRLTLILATFAEEPRIPSRIRAGYDKLSDTGGQASVTFHQWPTGLPPAEPER